jgi:hypothetical protein
MSPGLANVTVQQRLVAVRLFYDYLIEEGLRETNPVGRDATRPGAGSVATGTRAWCPGSPSCHGIPTRNTGWSASRQHRRCPSATASCWLWPMTPPCGGRSSGRCERRIMTPPTARSRCAAHLKMRNDDAKLAVKAITAQLADLAEPAASEGGGRGGQRPAQGRPGRVVPLLQARRSRHRPEGPAQAYHPGGGPDPAPPVGHSTRGGHPPGVPTRSRRPTRRPLSQPRSRCLWQSATPPALG